VAAAAAAAAAADDEAGIGREKEGAGCAVAGWLEEGGKKLHAGRNSVTRRKTGIMRGRQGEAGVRKVQAGDFF
jgi:hypothetical protein